jgi:hypothetical protein
MCKTLVIINKEYQGACRVAMQNMVNNEWIFNSVVHLADVANMLEDFGLHRMKKETRIMMDSRSSIFVELKNLGYKIQEVKL